MSLVVKHVTKKYKDFKAVNDISFEVKSGQMLGFLGRNGAGKTTTFRMILGLTSITEGEITYNGRPIGKNAYDDIGYLPEERGLHPKLTVNEELTYLATLKGMSPSACKKEISIWLERFGITENKDKKIESLSKGNQQKVQLLASLIHRPSLLILDEPFSGLDPVNVELLKDAVIELNKAGATIIFSSHRMDHVEELCDDVVILNKGEMVVSGPIQEVRDAYGVKEIVIECDFDLSEVADIPGVIDFKQTKTQTTLKFEDEAVAKAVYDVVTQKGFVKRFQIVEPSLNEIFIQKVGASHA